VYVVEKLHLSGTNGLHVNGNDDKPTDKKPPPGHDRRFMYNPPGHVFPEQNLQPFTEPPVQMRPYKWFFLGVFVQGAYVSYLRDGIRYSAKQSISSFAHSFY